MPNAAILMIIKKNCTNELLICLYDYKKNLWLAYVKLSRHPQNYIFINKIKPKKTQQLQITLNN